ncbi:hypothetical protein Tco_1268547 [Tanacetum coccineum]
MPPPPPLLSLLDSDENPTPKNKGRKRARVVETFANDIQLRCTPPSEASSAVELSCTPPSKLSSGDESIELDETSKDSSDAEDNNMLVDSEWESQGDILGYHALEKSPNGRKSVMNPKMSSYYVCLLSHILNLLENDDRSSTKHRNLYRGFMTLFRPLGDFSRA